MKQLLMMVLASLISVGLMVSDAEAKRLGGGKSSGMQRESVTRDAPRPPAAAPAQAAQPKSGMSKWLGPLAGLGIGALLGSMLGGMFGGGMGSLVMILLLVAAGYFVFRMLRNRNAAQSPPVQYAGLNRQARVEPRTSGPLAPAMPAGPSALSPAMPSGPSTLSPAMPSGSSALSAATPGGASALAPYPPGFEVEPFLRQAKGAFIRLQAANDAKELSDIRDFTTPEMYAEISLQMQERGDAPQKTDVVTLNADLLEVVTEDDRAIASVRFSGTIRETIGGPAEPFQEIWHVTKPLKDSKSTWLIAGIQQA